MFFFAVTRQSWQENLAYQELGTSEAKKKKKSKASQAMKRGLNVILHDRANYECKAVRTATSVMNLL